MNPTTPLSAPIDFLLQSYNALDPSVAADPTQLLYNLLEARPAPLTEAQVIRSETQPTFGKNYTEDKSAQTSYTNTAVSLGIEGSYGVYSGSVKVDYEKETDTASETLRSDYNSHTSCGTLVFSHSDDSVAIAAQLSPPVTAALNAIRTLADAERFTQTHGTHVILGVKLGGSLSIVIQISSSSFSEKEKLSAEVTAAYNGIGSVSAVAQAAHETKVAASASAVKQELKAMGGSFSTISLLDLNNEDSIKAWESSCSPATVSGLHKSIEFWKLATDTTAGPLLRHYLDLCLLKYSLENPVVFSNYGAITAFQYNTVTATVDANYKIIGGGAWLDPNGPDFLTASFPQLDSNQAINGWQAVSHDCMVASGGNSSVVAYALGVHDPANLLHIACTSASGSNPTIGADSAVAKVADGSLLTGGGIETSSDQPAARYVTGTFPGPHGSTDFNSWVARGHDYANASAATLTAWAVGLSAPNAKELLITKTVVTVNGGQQSHGTSFAALGTNQKIAGGGVELEQPGSESPDSLQNLLHATFPTTHQGVFGWQEYDGDLNGVFDKVVATAYGFTLAATSTVAGVTFKPFNVQARALAPTVA